MNRHALVAIGMGAVLCVSGHACADGYSKQSTSIPAQRTTAMTAQTPDSGGKGLHAPAAAEQHSAVIELSGTATATRTAVPVQLVLRNTGGVSLWVNQRLLINTEHAPAEARDVWFEVVAPDGHKLAFQEKVRAGAAEAKYYRALEKGQSKQIAIELSRYFEFDKPGTYEVIAHYQDGNPKPPLAPHGITHLASSLRSASLKLQIQ